jgi:hypothetical protein
LVTGLSLEVPLKGNLFKMKLEKKTNLDHVLAIAKRKKERKPS